MIVCARCGQQNPGAAVLCSHCGAELPRGPKTTPLAPLGEAVGTPPVVAPTAFGDFLPTGHIVDGKYAIERVLGEGGMGIVYLARDVNTDTHVVVKAMRTGLAHSDEFRARVRQEARSLAQIDHPNVVRLNAVVAKEDELLLVMQFVDGESLEKTVAANVANRTPMPLDRALSLFRQIVMGVSAAHQAGVVHRDIKPANVLVRAKDGVAKVTDFGIAKAEEDAKAGRGHTKGIIGSLWYMAPEQVTGRRDLDKRVDIYALGILFYELLIGTVPFDGASEYEIMKAITEAPMPSVSAQRADVPPSVDALISRATAKDRDHRFASCEDLVAAIDQVSYELRPPTSPDGQPLSFAMPPRSIAMPSTPFASSEPMEPPSRSKAPVLVVVGLLVLGALGVAGYLATRPQPPSTTPPDPSNKSATAPSASASAAARGPFAGLSGAWVSDTAHHYDAVEVGDMLEFRVHEPAEFAGQNYLAGEARFTLRATEKTGAFTVEDKIRPAPPSGYVYDARARGTCQEVWTDVKGTPLRAGFDGARLTVEMAKVTPQRGAFVTQTQNKTVTVVSCTRLTESAVDRVESTLARP